MTFVPTANRYLEGSMHRTTTSSPLLILLVSGVAFLSTNPAKAFDETLLFDELDNHSSSDCGVQWDGSTCVSTVTAFGAADRVTVAKLSGATNWTGIAIRGSGGVYPNGFWAEVTLDQQHCDGKLTFQAWASPFEQYGVPDTDGGQLGLRVEYRDVTGTTLAVVQRVLDPFVGTGNVELFAELPAPTGTATARFFLAVQDSTAATFIDSVRIGWLGQEEEPPEYPVCPLDPPPSGDCSSSDCAISCSGAGCSLVAYCDDDGKLLACDCVCEPLVSIVTEGGW